MAARGGGEGDRHPRANTTAAATEHPTVIDANAQTGHRRGTRRPPTGSVRTDNRPSAWQSITNFRQVAPLAFACAWYALSASTTPVGTCSATDFESVVVTDARATGCSADDSKSTRRWAQPGGTSSNSKVTASSTKRRSPALSAAAALEPTQQD